MRHSPSQISTPESQEGLKQRSLVSYEVNNIVGPESQEGLKLSQFPHLPPLLVFLAPESQEGLKQDEQNPNLKPI